MFCIGSACQLFFHFFFPLFSLSHLMKRSEQDLGAAQGSHCECMVQYDVMISIHINMKHQNQKVKTYIWFETNTLAKDKIEKKPRDTESSHRINSSMGHCKQKHYLFWFPISFLELEAESGNSLSLIAPKKLAAAASLQGAWKLGNLPDTQEALNTCKGWNTHI